MSTSGTTIKITAPGRAGIIGNPSDMYGGAVLACSVGLQAKVEISASSRLMLIHNECRCEIRNTKDLMLTGDRFDVVRAVLQYRGMPGQPFQLQYSSTIPIRSGLAGSTALLTALLKAILLWQGESPNPYQLAEMVCSVEDNHLKITGGFQDAYMCVFGGLNYLDFRRKQFDSKEGSVYATVEPLSSQHNIELPFVLATTGVERVSGAIHKPIAERWRAGEADVVTGYRTIAEIAQAGKRAFLNREWKRLGELMNENHHIQRALGGSGESNERLIAAALQAGALGAKLAGAGGGGTIIALWPHHDVQPLEQALLKAGASACYDPGIFPGVTQFKDEKAK
ncbi:MAG: hypothetical protein ACE5IR_28090 [bacterium]